MIITREWAMSSAWTFTIPPIKNMLNKYVHSGIWCDAYAGENSPAQVKNDLNGKHEYCMDALEFLKTRSDNEFDGVLIDPPYSLRQVSEHYKKAGIKITGWHTSSGYNSALKNEVNRVLKTGGKTIFFGWNTNAMGIKRGFDIVEILIVAHGGNKNDTLCTVEVKKENTIEKSFI
jgi:tRNA1(Val) A37 N6-methylase TrmN6